jgi:acetyl esterase/lipase
MPRAAEAPGPVMIGGRFDVESVYDVAYYDGPDADPRKHKLDLFLPKGQKNFPVLFFIHGGGWSSGDRKLYGGLGRLFAKNGVGSVVISYRLSPQVQHPGHVEDVARAFAWTYKNIRKYGGDRDRIFVTGQSAGGHLAALLATNEGYLKTHDLSVKAIKGVIPMSGVYSVPPGRLKRVLGDTPDAAKTASPLQNVSGKEPPFLILYADRDFPGCGLMSKVFYESLRKNKVEASLLEIKDRNHITIIFRLMFDEADPATQALLGFVASHSGMTLTPRDNPRGAADAG